MDKENISSRHLTINLMYYQQSVGDGSCQWVKIPAKKKCNGLELTSIAAFLLNVLHSLPVIRKPHKLYYEEILLEEMHPYFKRKQAYYKKPGCNQQRNVFFYICKK